MNTIKGTVLDVISQRQFKGEVHWEGGKITSVLETGEDVLDQYILPGLVDAHVHIESSMLVPSKFAETAVLHGTVATLSDPHEIANVCGKQGIEFMIEDAASVPLKFSFGVPSCVPATPFETAGAELNSREVQEILEREDFLYLSEMMNWPGVLNRDAQVMAKIETARKIYKPVDSHAPGLYGKDLEKYISAGISTDHECTTLEEAKEKLALGMKIIIREGSASRNFDALVPLLAEYPGKIMFCSDDKHPEDLLQGHINLLVARALNLGYGLWDVLGAACLVPARHYGLNVGLLQKNDPADFIVVQDLGSMQIKKTWIDGECVFDGDTVRMARTSISPVNRFTSYNLQSEDFIVPSQGEKFPVILAYEGSLLTGKSYEYLPEIQGELQPDCGEDILKIAVVNRYAECRPAVGFVRGFGLRDGAIASSVAHDSHNILIVGTSDAYLGRIGNLVMKHFGGIAAINNRQEEILPLPVGGIMSDRPCEEVARKYKRLTSMVREMGSKLQTPHMLLSFMALLVIPSLKISDAGIFDADKFEFIT